MNIETAVKALAEISQLQAKVIYALHVARTPIGTLAQALQLPVPRIQAEEAHAFKNLFLISIAESGDSFDDQAAKHATAMDKLLNKEKKTAKTPAQKAVGTKQTRKVKGTPEA